MDLLKQLTALLANIARHQYQVYDYVLLILVASGHLSFSW